jgi:hypothetical protein
VTYSGVFDATYAWHLQAIFLGKSSELGSIGYRPHSRLWAKEETSSLALREKILNQNLEISCKANHSKMAKESFKTRKSACAWFAVARLSLQSHYHLRPVIHYEDYEAYETINGTNNR